jgi:hypothetical protein
LWRRPWQEIADPAVGVALDDPGEDIGEIAERLDTVKFAGFDQRSDHTVFQQFGLKRSSSSRPTSS